jgi:hypothetical protein
MKRTCLFLLGTSVALAAIGIPCWFLGMVAGLGGGAARGAPVSDELAQSLFLFGGAAGFVIAPMTLVCSLVGLLIVRMRRKD